MRDQPGSLWEHLYRLYTDCNLRGLHPGSAGILQMLLTRSEVVLMQGVGHLPMFEQPERSALDYLQFRAKL